MLARLPEAPSGTRGITLFLVPKFLYGGKRNGVSCGRVEEKMGVHGVPACAINFDAAIGYLVGKPNKGMSAMFTMMNAARLAVGMQGLGIAEAAYQGAVAYATAKAGVVQVTKALAVELAFKGVRVNAIAPGWFVTDINRDFLAGPGAGLTRDIPVGRFGKDGDLDGALLLLASDAGSYMAGTTVVVDGGQVVAIRG